MKRNEIKIVSNGKSKKLSFYLKNDAGKWEIISDYSKLSREEFTLSSIFDTAEEIVSIIALDYNTGELGVVIQFMGTNDEYIYLKQCAEKYEDIEIRYQNVVVAVAGIIGTGKTVFIEAMCRCFGEEYSYVNINGCQKYTAGEAFPTWYEIKGIDYGEKYVFEAEATINKLVLEGITDFIYCLPSGGLKIQSSEIELINHVRTTFPSVRVLILLTQCLYAEDEIEQIVKQISGIFNGVEIIPVLAKEYKTRQGVIEAYGLDDVCSYLFGEV